MREPIQESLVAYMLSNDCSVASALSHVYPSLGQPTHSKKSIKDRIILENLTAGLIPSHKLLGTVAKALSIDKRLVSLLIKGIPIAVAHQKLLAKDARNGGIKTLNSRVVDITYFFKKNIIPLCFSELRQHIPPTLNTVMAYPNLPIDQRIQIFKEEKQYTNIHLAWIAYSNGKCNPSDGLRIVARQLISTSLGITIKVEATLSEFEPDTDMKVNVSHKGILHLDLHNQITPREFKRDSQIFLASVEKALFLYNQEQKNKGVKTLIFAPYKLHGKSPKRLSHCFSEAKKNSNSEAISYALSILDRYLKSHDVTSPFIKKKLYKVKEYFLVKEREKNNSTITKLIHRPNPYLLDCGDITNWDNVITCLEKQYSSPKRYNGISNLFKHLESEYIVKIDEDNNKVEVITSAEAYRTAIIIYLLKLYPKNNLAVSLSIVYDKKKSVSECFNTTALLAKSWQKNASNDFNLRHYDEEYMNIWEFYYAGNYFHIPFPLIKQPKANEYTEVYHPIRAINQTRLTDREKNFL